MIIKDIERTFPEMDYFKYNQENIIENKVILNPFEPYIISFHYLFSINKIVIII
jgi:hypothetical protein